MTFFVQIRGNVTRKFASRLKKLCDIQTIFTTRKLRICLPTLELSFGNILKSHAVYRDTCNGCNSIYVGQTSQHVTTRNSEHQKKKDPPVGQHLVECCGTAHNTYWEILDTCRGVKKLMTKEVIDIKKLKRHLIRLDEYREGGGGAGIDIEVLVQKQKICFLTFENYSSRLQFEFLSSPKSKKIKTNR